MSCPFPKQGLLSPSLSLKVTHSNRLTRNTVALTIWAQEQESTTGVIPGIPVALTCSEEAAYPFLCPGGLRAQDCSDGLVKHCLEAALRQS